MMAAYGGHASVVTLLLDVDADVELVDHVRAETDMMFSPIQMVVCTALLTAWLDRLTASIDPNTLMRDSMSGWSDSTHLGF
jgi:hypothetical protein